MGRRLAELFYELRARTEGLSQDVQVAERQLGKLSDFIDANPTAAAGALAAALVGVTVKATLMAAEVESSMKRVDRAIGATGAESQALRDDLQLLSGEFATSQAEIARLMKTVADNGPGGAAGLREITRAALELAELTGEDAGGLAAGLDGILDAFGRDAEQARTVAANLYAITKGRIPLTDLLDTLDKVAAKANASGLSLEQVAGAAASLRDANVPAKAVKATIEELANAGARGAEVLRDLAGQAAASGDNLRVYEKDLREAKQSVDKLAKATRIELDNALQGLGRVTLPVAHAALRMLGDLLDSASARARALQRNLEGVREMQLIPQTADGRIDYRSATARAQRAALVRGAGDFQQQGATLFKGQSANDLLAMAANAQRFLGADRPDDPAGLGASRAKVEAYARALAQAAAAAQQATAATRALDTAASGDGIAARVKAIAKATEDLGTLAPARVRAYVAELDGLGKRLAGTGNSSALLRAEIVALASKLEGDLPKAGKATERAFDATREKQQQFAEQMRRLAASLSATVTTGLQEQLREIDAQFAKLGGAAALPPAVAESYRTAREALLGVIRETERAEAAQRKQELGLERASRAAGDAVRDIGEALEKMRGGVDPESGESLLGDVDGTVAGLQQMQSTLERIVATEGIDGETKARARALLEEIKSLWDEIDRITGSVHVRTERTTASLGAQVQRLAGAARTLLDAAQAAGLLDTRLASALTSAINLAESLPAALSGDLGGIASVGAAALNLGKQLFGRREDPEAERRQQELERTLDALAATLRELNTTLGEINLQASAAARDAALGASRAVLRGGFAESPLGGAATFGAQVAGALQVAGITYEDLRAQAQQLRLELPAKMQDLTRAMLEAFVAAADTPAIAFEQLTQRWAVLNTTATEQLAQFLDFLEARLPGAVGDLARQVRTGFDLGTQQGRDAAIGFIREQFARPGSAIPADLAKRLIDMLQALAETGPAAAAAAGGVDALQAALDRFNAALSDLTLLASVAGPSVESVYGAIDAAVRQFPELGDALRSLVRDVDLSTEAGRAAFRERVRGLADGFAAADGLTDAERTTLRILQGLLGMLDRLGTGAAAAGEGVAGLTGALGALGDAARDIAQDTLATASEAATDAKRMGQDGAQAQANAFTAALPGLGQVDVNDPRSVSRAVNYLRGLYGGLQPTDTTYKALFGGMLDFFGQLSPSGGQGTGAPSSTPPGMASLTSSVEAISRVDAVTIADALTTGVALDRERNALLARMDAQLAGLLAGGVGAGARAPLLAPPLGGPGAGGAAAGTGPVIVQVTVQELRFQAPTDRDTARGLGTAWAEGAGGGLARQVNRELGQQARVDGYLQGRR